MKKLFLLIIILGNVGVGYCQTSSAINYQTMIHGAEGIALTNTAISLKMSIRSDAPDGFSG